MRGIRRARRFNFTTPQILIPVFLAVIFCWVVSYLSSIGFPLYGEISDTPLWYKICDLLSDKLLTYCIGGALMLGGAFLLHRTNLVLMLIREKTFLPFVLYTLFISTNIDFFPLKATSLGLFCLIFALYYLFISYHDIYTSENAYKSALLIGAGSLLWIHLLWFIPLFWWGMNKFRCFSFRTFLASVLGLITIYWFLAGWCLYHRDFTLLTTSFSILANFRFASINTFVITDWISILTLVLLTLTASVHIITHEMEESLRSRQFLYFLMLMACWSFILFIIYNQTSEEFIQAACIPASILVAHFFAIIRNHRWSLWIFILMCLVLFTNLFIQLWSFL